MSFVCKRCQYTCPTRQALEKHLLRKTDVTNETTHAEVKGWKEWKYAMGQLLAYQTEDPKDNLKVCLFGKYDNVCKVRAIKVLRERGISCYEFLDKDDYVSIKDAANGSVVYEYKLK